MSDNIINKIRISTTDYSISSVKYEHNIYFRYISGTDSDVPTSVYSTISFSFVNNSNTAITSASDLLAALKVKFGNNAQLTNTASGIMDFGANGISGDLYKTPINNIKINNTDETLEVQYFSFALDTFSTMIYAYTAAGASISFTDTPIEI